MVIEDLLCPQTGTRPVTGFVTLKPEVLQWTRRNARFASPFRSFSKARKIERRARISFYRTLSGRYINMKNAHQMVEAAKAHIKEVSLDQASDAIKQADFLIDVREPDEFREGHIAGAINIPRGLLEFKLSADPALDDRGLNLVIYCKNSGRAALSAQAMKEMGYARVLSISGGIDAWQAADKPVVKPSLPEFD
ncbi:MAG: rhodanese-like domain-containing protein [Rhizobiaceae bacterium]